MSERCSKPMKVLFFATAETVIVDTLAMIFQANGQDAKAVHNSADAIRAAVEFRPDWVFTILNNIGDSKPHDLVAEILRVHPSCKFFLAAGNPVPGFEQGLNAAGFAIKNLVPLPIHPSDMLGYFKQDSMIAPLEGG
jgi:hypothetical protein